MPPSADIGLPDIDAALMVLMGLGQGAYLGKKSVTTSTPRLSGVSPSVVAAGTTPTVALSGAALGDGVGDQVLLNGVPLTVPPTSWSDTSIQFAWLDAQPNGTPWASGQAASVSLVVNGQASNSLPVLVQASPPPPPLQVAIRNIPGAAVEAANGAPQVVLAGAPREP